MPTPKKKAGKIEPITVDGWVSYEDIHLFYPPKGKKNILKLKLQVKIEPEETSNV